MISDRELELLAYLRIGDAVLALGQIRAAYTISLCDSAYGISIP
jgi:hypothetical protein